MECDNCGTTEDVERTICPFAEEIYQEIEEVDLCSDCYYERCMDI